MKKVALIVALATAAIMVVQPGWAARKAAKRACTPASAMEAEVALQYMTDLMVVSSVCQDTVYAEFRLRNKDAIIGYQKALIRHFHGNAGFDRWNTALANQAAQKQMGNMDGHVCVQSAPLLQQAKALDPKGFRAYAAAQAAAVLRSQKCGK
ncbi:MAG TPA: hypothetical protein VNF04_08845 [Stellaceae bacterium]|nr:hypothetical protein [Stellaceae bacterium]